MADPFDPNAEGADARRLNVAVSAADNKVYNPDYIRPGGTSLTGSGGFFGPAPAGTQTLTELMIASGFPAPKTYEKAPDSGLDWNGALAFQPQGSNWVLKAGIRYGRSNRSQSMRQSEIPGTRTKRELGPGKYQVCATLGTPDSVIYEQCHSGFYHKFIEAHSHESE